ncbi:alpha/beta fold hydrolase [Salinactinospora qingdaonensis]
MRPLAGSLTVLTMLAVTACGALGTAETGEVIDAAGQRQWVSCTGEETPAVVLVHGIGDRANSSYWRATQQELAGKHRTCRYDRPGTGNSPAPSRSGRDGQDLAAELDTVVNRADADDPVIVVAHSFGGYPALVYAQHHRDRVAGLVLVEAVEPDYGLRAGVGVDHWDEVGQADEDLDLAAVQRQARQVDSLEDLPLTVLRRGQGASPQWKQAQESLTHLSSASVLRVAQQAGHEVPAEEPEAVSAAIAALPSP